MSSLAYASHAATCLSVLKDGSDNHDIPGFQKIVTCLLSPRQQIQHNVLIILMVLGHSNACNIVKHRRLPGSSVAARKQIQHYVVIVFMVLGHPNACNIVKHRGLSGVIYGCLENLKAVITHGWADSRERRRASWRMCRVLLSVACQS